jgi:hypothetical protein
LLGRLYKDRRAKTGEYHRMIEMLFDILQREIKFDVSGSNTSATRVRVTTSKEHQLVQPAMSTNQEGVQPTTFNHMQGLRPVRYSHEEDLQPTTSDDKSSVVPDLYYGEVQPWDICRV